MEPPAPPAEDKVSGWGPARSRLWAWARLAAGIGLIAYLVGTGSLDPGLLSRVRPGLPLAALIMITGLALFATSLRWVMVARAWGGQGRRAGLLRVGLYTNVFTFVTPGGVGTDATRALYLKRAAGVSWTRAGVVGLADRLIGLQALLCAASATSWAVGALTFAPALSLVAGLSIVGPSLAVRFADRFPVGGRWKLLPALANPVDKRALAAAYGCSAAAAVLNGVLPLFGMASLESAPAAVHALGSSFLVVLINSIAPTPGGLGVGETAAAGLLSRETAAAGMLVVRGAALIWALILGLGAVAAPAAIPDAEALPR